MLITTKNEKNGGRYFSFGLFLTINMQAFVTLQHIFPPTNYFNLSCLFCALVVRSLKVPQILLISCIHIEVLTSVSGSIKHIITVMLLTAPHPELSIILHYLYFCVIRLYKLLQHVKITFTPSLSEADKLEM